MNSPVTCGCGREAEPCYEEVDIGVGVQKHLVGWECSHHGGICGVCAGCGVPDKIGYVHEPWCSESPGETITVDVFEVETNRLRDKVVERFGRRS